MHNIYYTTKLDVIIQCELGREAGGQTSLPDTNLVLVSVNDINSFILNERICQLCKLEIEDEIHFLLQCLILNSFRTEAMQQISDICKIFASFLYVMHIIQIGKYL
jgi:hypothetical protein